MATHKNVNGFTRREFTETFFPFIERITRGTGILPETLLSVAILESSGKYGGKWLVGGSTLSRKANNYHGIKCGKGWHGKTFNIDTGEVAKDGTHYVDKNACFRRYPSIEASMRDYVRFLKSNPRYSKVFGQPNVLAQAKALKAAGYATAPNYAQTVYNVYLSQKSLIDDIKKKSALN